MAVTVEVNKLRNMFTAVGPMNREGSLFSWRAEDPSARSLYQHETAEFDFMQHSDRTTLQWEFDA
jgi:hypothetical protein